QHDQHLLAALVFVDPRNRLAPPRRRFPVDDPGVVSRDPLAETLEQPALTGTPDAPEACLAPAGHPARQRSESGPGQVGEDGRVPGDVSPLLLPGESEWSEAPNRHAPAAAATPPNRRDVERLVVHPGHQPDGALRDVGAAQWRRKPLTHPHDLRPARAQGPSICHGKRAAGGERRRRIALHKQRARTGPDGIPGEQADPDDVGAGVEQYRSRPDERRQRQQRERGGADEPAAGWNDHARGTSTRSITDARAASAETPSSSSSGATTTRWRSTAGASCFTSSGVM